MTFLGGFRLSKVTLLAGEYLHKRYLSAGPGEFRIISFKYFRGC